MELESIDCPVCGPSDTWEWLRAQDRNFFGPGEYPLRRCRGCQLVFVSPRPTVAHMEAFYPRHYWTDPTPEGGETYLDAGMRRALAHLGSTHPGGRVLDVGCGVGNMPALMRERGLDAFGLEPYEHASRIARERYGIEVVCAFLQEAGLEEQSLDGLTMFDVLEHVHDPLGDLREAHRLLRPGGSLIVKVPNITALQAGLFGPWWYWLDVPRHLFHFSPHSLSAALRAAGFEDVRCSAIPEPAGAVVFEVSVVYWLRDLQLRRRGLQVAPTEDQTVGEVLEGQVYAGVPSAGKRAFRWLVRNVLYAPLAVENLIGRSVELLAVARRPRAEAEGSL